MPRSLLSFLFPAFDFALQTQLLTSGLLAVQGDSSNSGTLLWPQAGDKGGWVSISGAHPRLLCMARCMVAWWVPACLHRYGTGSTMDPAYPSNHRFPHPGAGSSCSPTTNLLVLSWDLTPPLQLNTLAVP